MLEKLFCNEVNDVDKSHRSDGGDEPAEALHGLLVCLLEQLPDALVHDFPVEHLDPVKLSDKANVTKGSPPQLHLLEYRNYVKRKKCCIRLDLPELQTRL